MKKVRTNINRPWTLQELFLLLSSIAGIYSGYYLYYDPYNLFGWNEYKLKKELCREKEAPKFPRWSEYPEISANVKKSHLIENEIKVNRSEKINDLKEEPGEKIKIVTGGRGTGKTILFQDLCEKVTGEKDACLLYDLQNSHQGRIWYTIYTKLGLKTDKVTNDQNLMEDVLKRLNSKGKKVYLVFDNAEQLIPQTGKMKEEAGNFCMT